MRMKVVNNPVKDWPYRDLLLPMIRFRDEGKSVVPKFTCENCGERAYGTINDLGRMQTCSECGGLHDWEKSGGNYALGQILNPYTELSADEATAQWLRERKG